MKRDMDLIRLLLLMVEGEEKPDLTQYTEKQQVYHMSLLIDAKLVRGAVINDKNGQPVTALPLGLTWQGHEFLDIARNDVIWKKAWEMIKSAGVTIALPILQDILTSLAKKKLQLD